MTIPAFIPTDKIKDVKNFITDSIEKAIKFGNYQFR